MIACALVLASGAPAVGSDLGPGGETLSPPSGWEYSLTPYGWMINVNADMTAAGFTTDVNENFFQIVEKSDRLLAAMGYFEARKDKLALFADVVWYDLQFSGSTSAQADRRLSADPFAKFPNVKVKVSTDLNVKGSADLDYQSTIITSGAAYEVAKWSNGNSQTSLDLLGGARYWNNDTNVDLRLSGNVKVDITGTAKIKTVDLIERAFEARGVKLRPATVRLLKRIIAKRGIAKSERIRRTVQIELQRALVTSQDSDLEWVDPFVGFQLRRKMKGAQELRFESDFGGFGVGSEFSWGAVATYGFDVNCFGRTVHALVGYRALFVDYSENGKFGPDGIDGYQHGPIMGGTMRW